MLYLALVAFAIASLLVNLKVYPFRNEESLRAIVAYEMYHSGNYAQPTFLGELYFNKPPLFNWLILLYSKLFSWNELTVRAVTLTFLVLTAILIFLFTNSLLKNKKVSILAVLIFLTFGNVLFFYGYLGEIDITFTFFVFSIMVSLYYSKEKPLFLVVSGFLTALAFLLKGFPAYAFLGISLLVLSLHWKSLRFLFSKYSITAYLIAVALPLLWLLITQDPTSYIKRLFFESFSRVSNQDFDRLKHLFSYPLLTLKDTLPWSALFLVSLFKFRQMKIPQEVKLLIFLFAGNYLPYLLSKSEGRYVIPLYPLLAIALAYFISQVESEKFRRFIYIVASVTILLRFAYGLVYFPYYAKKESSLKNVAMDVYSIVGDSKVACDCADFKTVCLYVGILQGKPLKMSKYTPNAQYVISCDLKTSANVIKEYNKGRIKLIGTDKR